MVTNATRDFASFASRRRNLRSHRSDTGCLGNSKTSLPSIEQIAVGLSTAEAMLLLDERSQLLLHQLLQLLSR